MAVNLEILSSWNNELEALDLTVEPREEVLETTPQDLVHKVERSDLGAGVPETKVPSAEEIVPEETPEERRQRMEAMKAEMRAYEGEARPIPNEVLARFAQALDRGESSWEGLTRQMRGRFEAAEGYQERVASWKERAEEEKRIKPTRWQQLRQRGRAAAESARELGGKAKERVVEGRAARKEEKENRLWRELNIEDTEEARKQALTEWQSLKERKVSLDIRKLALLLKEGKISSDDSTEEEKTYLRQFKKDAKKYGIDIKELLREKEETRWDKVWRGVKNAAKSWWDSVSPYERNKIIWGAGPGVGLVESVAVDMYLPGVGGWLKGIANAALMNGANLGLKYCYTRQTETIKRRIESEGNEEVRQQLQETFDANEKKYSKAMNYLQDFWAGAAAGATVYAAGRIVYTAGEAVYNAYIRPTEIAPSLTEEASREAVRPPTVPKTTEEVKRVFRPPVTKAAERVAEVKPSVEVAAVKPPIEVKPPFLSEVKIDSTKGAGNFWKAFERMAENKIPGVDWINPENGVTKTDVINHAIIKLLRARGVKVDVVQNGQVFKLMELLKPEEKDLIEKIAVTKDVAGYLKVRPQPLSLLNK